MLKLFRNIRHRLLRENRVTRYLFYPATKMNVVVSDYFSLTFHVVNFVIPAKAGIHNEYDMLNKNVHQYYLYRISNKYNGTLYIGVTNDLERRMLKHKNQINNGFSKKYGLTRLVYFETFQYVNDAIKREKNMKKWKRGWKINLIEEENPRWNDLAKEWPNQELK